MNPTLQPAPGSKAAKNCGIISIIADFTCIGLPIGIVLAIIALVKQSNAKAAAKAEPDLYEMPTQTGLVTGIIGLVMPVFILPLIGIISAIAVPAMLTQRARAKDKVSISNMIDRQTELAIEYDKLSNNKTPPLEIPTKLELFLKASAQQNRNPWAPMEGSAAFDFHIRVATNLDQDALENMAIGEATTLGRPVFVLELPTNRKSGYLAGAVRVKNRMDNGPVCSKVIPLE